MMSGDELAAELYRRQGFLLIGTMIQRSIGSVMLESKNITWRSPAEQPVHVVATATQEDFVKQCEIAAELLGEDLNNCFMDFTYIYRVESD